MNDNTSQLSGLTDYELECDKVCDKIKKTKSSLESIKILQRFIDKNLSSNERKSVRKHEDRNARSYVQAYLHHLYDKQRCKHKKTKEHDRA